MLQVAVSRSATYAGILVLIAASMFACYGVYWREFHESKFPVVLPLYFRGVGLCIMGLWCWGFVATMLTGPFGPLDMIRLLGISAPPAIRPVDIFVLAGVMSAIYTVHLGLFTYIRIYVNLPALTIPMLLYTCLGLVLSWPFKTSVCVHSQASARATLLRSLLSTLMSPVSSTGVLFAHVVIADVLTSYSKVLGDVAVTVCTFRLGPDHHFHKEVLKRCSSSELLPVMLSALPALLRFCQCIRAYRDTTAPKHIANAVKYLSILPVIIFGAARVASSASPDELLFNCWIVSATFNALYSFWWDVVMDWGLKTGGKHFFTRDRLLLSRNATFYRCCVFVDLLLRLAWIAPLSPHFHVLPGASLFFLEVAEVVRRTIWVFLRVEWESIVESRKTIGSSNEGHL